MDTATLPDFLKDVASQGALVYTITQIVKDVLQRWYGEVDAQMTRGVALAFSLLVAACVYAPITPDWPRWILTVFGYGTVVVMPVALAGHVVARLGTGEERLARMARVARKAPQV